MHSWSWRSRLRLTLQASLNTASVRPSQRWHLIVIRGSHKTSSRPPQRAVLERVNAGFIARCVRMTGADGTLSAVIGPRDKGVVPYIHGLFFGEAIDNYPVRCASKRELFLSIKASWNAILSMMKRVSSGKSKSEIKSRHCNPLTFPFPELVTRPLVVAIAIMRAQRVQDFSLVQSLKTRASWRIPLVN